MERHEKQEAEGLRLEPHMPESTVAGTPESDLGGTGRRCVKGCLWGEGRETVWVAVTWVIRLGRVLAAVPSPSPVIPGALSGNHYSSRPHRPENSIIVPSMESSRLFLSSPPQSRTLRRSLHSSSKLHIFF